MRGKSKFNLLKENLKFKKQWVAAKTYTSRMTSLLGSWMKNSNLIRRHLETSKEMKALELLCKISMILKRI